jgi:peptidoglycan hydrolase-like protein with peptidoglycan-binding domain
MNIKTKIVTALTLAVLVVPGISFAQTTSVADLQTLIASLMAQVQQLQAQLAAQTGGTTSWCYTFNTNLSVGMSGSAVSALQTALQKDGESVTVNGTFDDQTAAAVTGFQEKYASAILAPYNLSNGTGYAGSGTRSKLNSLFGCTGSNPITTPIVVNPIAPTSSAPVACSLLVPYCPYGSHSVAESNGCSQTVCNAAPTQTPTITVLSPNGGTLTSGAAYNITYSSSYPTNDEPETGVALYQGNTLIGYPVTTSVGTDNLSWNVGQYTVNGSGAPQVALAGSNYFIQVYMAGGAKGMSSAPFSIVAPSQPTTTQPTNVSPSITIISPTTGGTLTVGQSIPYQVQVTTQKTMGGFSFGLTDTNSGYPLMSGNGLPLVGSNGYSTVPAGGIYSGTGTFPGSLPAGKYYLYASFASQDGSQLLHSYSPFTFTVPVATLSPLGGANWQQGTTQTILWQTATPGQPTSVGLNLYQNGNLVQGIGNVPNTGSVYGSYLWTVPSGLTGSNFQIHIFADGGYADSPAFTISPLSQ